MILTGPEIRRQLDKGDIKITPFDPELLNPASVDLRLGGRFFEYSGVRQPDGVLDARADNPGEETSYEDGAPVLLIPGRLYLGHTLERIWSNRAVPIVDGKSSIGRLGVSVHQTAGYGDPGFDGQYTLEITVVHTTRLYVGMRIAQMRFHASVGDFASYKGRYVGDAAMGPVPSRLALPAPVAALPPAKKNPHDALLGNGKFVKVRFKDSSGKVEKMKNGEGVIVSFNERYIRVRVWGGTAMPDPIHEIERASDDWSLKFA